VDLSEVHGETEAIVVDGNEEATVEGSEEVIVGTIPCSTNEKGTKNGETIAKEPIVYRRRRFKSQEEQLSLPQPQQSISPVPNLSSDLSPSSSSTQSESSGNVFPTPEHVDSCTT
jgi:hypothetical protein